MSLLTFHIGSHRYPHAMATILSKFLFNLSYRVATARYCFNRAKVFFIKCRYLCKPQCLHRGSQYSFNYVCSTAQKTLYKRATIHAHNSFFLDEFETNYPHQPECMLTLSRRAGLSSQSGARLPYPLLLRAPDFFSMGEIV